MDANTVFESSGHQRGHPSKAGLLVRLRGDEPSAFITKTSEFFGAIILRNTMRRPSCEKLERITSGSV